MSGRVNRHERMAWIAVVAVLATSLAWLAAVNVAWLVHAWATRTPAVQAASRALLHLAARTLGHVPVAALALATVVAVVVVLAAALRSGRPIEGRMGHV